MTKRNGLVLAATLLLVAAPLVAGDLRPFKGSATAEMVSFDYATMSAVFAITDGNTAHLGKVTGSATVYYDPVTFYPNSAAVTLVAANGDKLLLWTTMSAYSFTGGTGRFADATGSGAFSAVNVGDVEDGIVALGWEGLISY